MSSDRNIYLYWVGKEYKLISILHLFSFKTPIFFIIADVFNFI